MKTADFVRTCLVNAKVINPREETPAVYVSDGLQILNEVLSSWSGLGIYVPFTTSIQINLVPDVFEYVVTPPILELQEANLVDASNVKSRLTPVDKFFYNTQNNVLAKGRPFYIYYSTDNEFETINSRERSTTVTFFVTPVTYYTANLIIKRPLAHLTIDEEISSLPDFYFLALRMMTTYHISIYFSTVLDPRFNEELQSLKTQLKAMIPVDMSINVDNPFRDVMRLKPGNLFYVG